MKHYHSINMILKKPSNKTYGKKASLLTIILLTITVISGACKKFVEIGTPHDRLITETVFSSSETAISAITGIYARMNNENTLPYNIALFTGQYGDELENFSTSKNLVAVYTNSLNQIDATSPNFWQIWYNHIFQANAAWEGCNNSNSLNTVVKKQLMGEARFIRAFWYLYLVNIYGNVPLITSTDYTNNNVAANSDKEKLYAQIITDLSEAEASLNTDYIAGNTVSSSDERVRPNVYAAKALLARAFLYNGNNEQAEIKSSEVIDQAALYKLEALADVFLKTSKEAIWEIMTPMPANGTFNTYEGLNFILTNRPSSGLTANSSISMQLLSAFEPGDLRRSAWIGEYIYRATTPNISYFFVNKFKIKSSIAESSEYTMPLRLAEQYLIRAEARAKQGKLAKAVEDVDIIRERAGLPLIKNINPSLNQEDLLKVIFHERQVEFFIEWGHRWFDLKRSGKADVVMPAVALAKGGSWDSYKQFWPIPIREIQNNPNLVQNQGYK